jgi:hypothetical protein
MLTLRHKIAHLLYERAAGSKKPDELIRRDLALLRDEDRMNDLKRFLPGIFDACQ